MNDTTGTSAGAASGDASPEGAAAERGPGSTAGGPAGDPTDVRRRVLATAAPVHVVEVTAVGTGSEDIDARADAPAVSPSPGTDVPAPSSSSGTFMCLHGYGGSSYLWRHWEGALAARGRVLLVDMKGFGAAPKPDDDRYSPDDLAAAVVALIREHDLRDLTLVGQSLGGGVALLTALSLRDEGAGRLSRMVLLAPAAYRQKAPPFVRLAHRPRMASAIMRAVGPRRIVRWTMRSIVHDPACVGEAAVVEYSRAWETAEGRRAALCAGRQILPPDIDERTRRYRELDVPTLLLWGDADRVVPLRMGERLQRELPDARLVVLEDCGHMATDERPVASLAVLERFLTERPD